MLPLLELSRNSPQASSDERYYASFRDRLRRVVRITLFTTAGLLLLLTAAVYWLWNDRRELAEIPIPAIPTRVPPVDAVTATWFGTSTLLFDDGETQILIDGFVSRPAPLRQLLNRTVESDAAAINRFMLDNRLDRLAAVIPAHTHLDHALDIGAIANRSRASIIGSPSAILIGRGAGVPDDQLVAVGSTTEFTFGEFTVTLIPSRHAGFGWNGTVPLDGNVKLPLAQPARPSEFRAGLAFTVVIAHPQGTALVQASAGVIPASLRNINADVVFLGTGMLETMGRDYAEDYWLETVTATGASLVVPIHFDDYTRPFGITELPPTIISDFATTANWLQEFRSRWDRDAALELPVFGQAITLYTGRASTGT